MRPDNLNGGRPHKLTDNQVEYIKLNLGQPIRKLASELSVHYVTIYRTLANDQNRQTYRRPHRRRTPPNRPGKAGEDYREDKGN